MHYISPYHTDAHQNNEYIFLSLTQIFEILTKPYPIIEFLLIFKKQSFMSWKNQDIFLKYNYFFKKMECKQIFVLNLIISRVYETTGLLLTRFIVWQTVKANSTIITFFRLQLLTQGTPCAWCKLNAYCCGNN